MSINSNKTAIILATALITTKKPEGAYRVDQYINGFKQINELVSNNSDKYDVFFVDCTIKREDVDNSIIKEIEGIRNLKEIIFTDNNFFGSFNKGSGVITQWKEILKKISEEYEYVIHFEPRMKIRDFSFFDRFDLNKDSYFNVTETLVKGKNFRQFFTGIFSIKRKDLVDYVNEANIIFLTLTKKNLEKDMFEFFIKNKIHFIEVEKLGVDWFYLGNEKYLEL